MPKVLNLCNSTVRSEPVKCVNKVIHYKFFVISYGASCPWGKLSVGRVVMGRVGNGASCP